MTKKVIYMGKCFTALEIKMVLNFLLSLEIQYTASLLQAFQQTNLLLFEVVNNILNKEIFKFIVKYTAKIGDTD